MFNKIQKSVEEMLEFPPDVLGDEPKITLHGNRRILIENFSEIKSFSETEIEVETTAGIIRLSGLSFILRTILPTELEIEGTVLSLEFDKGGNP